MIMSMYRDFVVMIMCLCQAVQGWQKLMLTHQNKYIWLLATLGLGCVWDRPGMQLNPCGSCQAGMNLKLIGEGVFG